MKRISVKIKKIILFFILLNPFQSYSQQSNTLYYMNKVPQSMFLNPAYQYNCKYFIGVPGLSSIYINLVSTGFAYQQIIQYDGDSLLHPFHPDYNYNALMKTLKPINYIVIEANLDIFTAGYKFKENYYFSFNITEKIDAKFSFPRDLVQLIHDGNGKAFMDKTVSFEGLNFNFHHYREYGLGVSRKFEKLTIGVRPKLLFGKANYWTAKNIIQWTTDSADGDFDYTLNTDIEIDISQPFIKINNCYYDEERDTFILDTLDNNITTSQYIFNRKNPGLGLDIGIIYNYSDKLNFYASIIDVGFIHWRSGTANFKQKVNNFKFQGLNIVPLLNKKDTTDHFQKLADSLVHIFNFQYSAKPYFSYLTPKIYLGGTYKLREKYVFGLLARCEFYKKVLHTSLTLSAMAQLVKWLDASMSYSIINSRFTNIGLGLSLKAGPVHFYIVNDNIIGSFLLYNTRNLNIRFGFNVIFGCPQEKAEALLESPREF